MQLGQREARKMLEKHGLRMPRERECGSLSELVEKSKSFKPPLVLKVLVESESHKTDKGLVFTGIHAADELKEAFGILNSRAAGLKRSYLLQEQARGVEIIVGAKRDPAFGPVILLGLGGVQAELLHDVAIRVAPLSAADAASMIADTHVSKFVEGSGFRGKKADKKRIIEVLMKTSSLVLKNPQIAELDFNPVIVNKDNALVVDARIVI